MSAEMAAIDIGRPRIAPLLSMRSVTTGPGIRSPPTCKRLCAGFTTTPRGGGVEQSPSWSKSQNATAGP